MFPPSVFRVPYAVVRLFFDRLIGRHKHGPGRVRKVLLTRVQNLGDCVVFLPTIARIKQFFPELELHVLAGTAAGEQIFKMCPAVDKILRTSWGREKGNREKLRELDMIAREKYDVVLLSTEETGSAFKMFAAGIPFRVGFEAIEHMNESYRENRPYLLNRRLSQPKGMHEVEVNLQLADVLGSRGCSVCFPLEIPDDAVHATNRLLNEIGVNSSPFVAVHAGTKQQVKRWEPERFADACDTIFNGGYKVVFVGTAEDSDTTARTIRLMKTPAFDITGKTTIPELAAVFKSATGFIGNDSGPMHLAAALGLPVTAIFTASDPVVWGPWCNNGCKAVFQGPDTDPKAVGEALLALLRSQEKKAAS